MRIGVIITLIILFTNTIILAAEEKTLTAPFPDTTFDSHAHIFFCNATLGTSLDATSKERRLALSGIEKAGIFAKVYRATDRLAWRYGKVNSTCLEEMSLNKARQLVNSRLR
jgi:hypothetical protein